jgi:hypothetical protein
MGLIREPREIDFTIQSTPWTEDELKDFRVLMQKQKAERSNKQQNVRLKKQFA